MRKFVLIMLALIGALVVLVVIAAAGVALISVMIQGRVPGKVVLEVDLEDTFVEYVPDEPFSKLLYGKKLSIRDLVDALEKASADDRVVGFVARVGAAPMGLAEIQEIRDAVKAFRASGKPAVAYSETFGEVGPGNGAYYLATAFDKIYLQPSGDVGLTGLIYETPFIRGTLDKLGMKPRMDHRWQYKNAMNVFTEREYTKAHREATQAVMNSQFDQILQGIADDRRMDQDQVRGLVDRGPFLGNDAVQAGLVDELAYRDQVYDEIKDQVGGHAKFLFLSKYLERAGRPHVRGKTVALIYGVGTVTRGPSGYDPLFGSASMGSDTVVAAFRDAIAAHDVKAIIFRVDSPGGSYVASDAIWRETVRAREAGKPVIVTMGDVAGSGGYFVAMAADKIVAQPGTITASIGVLGGKILTTGFWDKLGVSWDEVHTSDNATMWSATEDYTPAEWKRFEAWLDRVYDDFTTKVSEGRGLTKEHVLEIARGRIWTGQDAKDLGLVDELGGFPTAYRLAREALGMKPDEEIRIRVYPRPKSAFEVLLEEGPEGSEPSAEAEAVVRVMQAARPVARLASRLGLVDPPGVLTMPAVEARP